MAEHRGLEPLPVTVDLVGSLFKAAKYRSSAQYFAVAKCKHIEAGFQWTQQLDLARSQAIRSIQRGMGPSSPKLDLFFDNVKLDFAASLDSAYDELELPLTVRVKEPFVTALTAVWFLLRGIEIANVVGNDVRFNKANRSVTVRLPVSKTDTEGKGCERTRICICSPRHDPGCAASTPPALMFTSLQKCSCREGRHPLCVFHALLDLVVRKRRTGSYDPQAPLFGDDGVPPSAKQLTKLAQVCAFVLHNEALHEWSPAAIEKWSQHCFGVSGAQLFARAEVTLPVIQVIGRWGSLAIWRYVQESVFCPTKTAALVRFSGQAASSEFRPSTTSSTGFDEAAVSALVHRVVAESWQSKATVVHHPRTKFAHKPCENELSLQSVDWVTACGRWYYGCNNHLRHPSVLPGFSRCTKCFASSSQPSSVALGSDQQQASDSSSGEDSSSS